MISVGTFSSFISMVILLSDRILAREVPARERLADDDDVGLLAHLALGEQAPAQERHAHRAEVAVVADAHLGDGRPGPAAGSGSPRIAEAGGGAEPREGQVADHARRRGRREGPRCGRRPARRTARAFGSSGYRALGSVTRAVRTPSGVEAGMDPAADCRGS